MNRGGQTPAMSFKPSMARGRGEVDKKTKAGNWTFLTNHAHVLLYIAQRPEARMRDMAEVVGITERAVQRIIAELEQAGYIRRIRDGRCNHYEIHTNLALRHPIEQHRRISALIALLSKPGR